MANAPAFASTPRIGVGVVSVANTSRTGSSGTIVDIITSSAAAGLLLSRVVVAATADPADSVVTLFLSDGTTTWYFDEFDLGDPAAGSNTVSPYRAERPYTDLVLPQNWKLRAAITVAPTSGVLNVFAFGADLT